MQRRSRLLRIVVAVSVASACVNEASDGASSVTVPDGSHTAVTQPVATTASTGAPPTTTTSPSTTTTHSTTTSSTATTTTETPLGTLDETLARFHAAAGEMVLVSVGGDEAAMRAFWSGWTSELAAMTLPEPMDDLGAAWRELAAEMTALLGPPVDVAGLWEATGRIHDRLVLIDALQTGLAVETLRSRPDDLARYLVDALAINRDSALLIDAVFATARIFTGDREATVAELVARTDELERLNRARAELSAPPDVAELHQRQIVVTGAWIEMIRAAASLRKDGVDPPAELLATQQELNVALPAITAEWYSLTAAVLLDTGPD